MTPAQRKHAYMASHGVIEFAPAVTALGTAAFATELLAALNRCLVVDHLAIMRFEDRIGPPVIESAVWLGGEHVATVQRAYLERFHGLDPVRRCTGVAPQVLRLHRNDIANAQYRETAYVRAGLLERVSVVTTNGSRLITLNLYRRERSGAFARRHLRMIEAQAVLLAALVLKHVGFNSALLRSRDRIDRMVVLTARLQALEPRLTRRELDVLARALVGMTSAGIALELRISLNTVLTYRKRAYGRLGVSSQAELFSRCIN